MNEKELKLEEIKLEEINNEIERLEEKQAQQLENSHFASAEMTRREIQSLYKQKEGLL